MFNFLSKSLKSLIDNLKNLNKPLMIFIILFVIATFVYVYYNQIKPLRINNYKPNKEFVGHKDDYEKQVDLYYFYTTWCPYCKKSKPEWDSIKEEYKIKKINGYTINFIEIDCDKDTTTADKFNVEGYPTVKLIKDTQVIEYDAKVDRTSLNLFLEEMLKNN
tara:strand:- start:1923 stop:2408 length:486 start_codon:yes stop_codon:yes gene_type:complete